MKSFEFTGEWWLPQNQEHRVAGTVSFIDDDQITLTLEGLLEPEYARSASMRKARKYSFILGQIQDGRAITLVDCFERNVTFKFFDESGGSETCLAMTCYIGTHFMNLEEIRFHAIDVSYSHLPQWAGVFPYYGYQKAFDAVVAKTTNGTIAVQPTSLLKENLEHHFIDEHSLPEAVSIHLEVQRPLSLEQWTIQFITPLQDLLTLTTQRLNTLVSIHAYVQRKNETQISTIGIDEISPVQVIFPEARQPIAPPKPCIPETILFSLHDIADNFSSIMEAWLQASEALNSVYSLFFGARYSALYLNQRFLFIAQAAESYQSRRSERLDHSEDEHRAIVELLMATSPEKFRDWLAEVLKYSNVASFRRKLKDLVSSTNEILAPLIGANSKARQAFVESVYNTRNYLTHYDETLKSKAATGDQLFFITQYLSIALQTRLLYELGFTPQQCMAMFEKHEVYQFLLHAESYVE